MDLPDKTVLLFTNLRDGHNSRSYIFREPRREITCRAPGGAHAAFTEVEKALRQGLYVAGYFTYEFGYFLDDTGVKPAAVEAPLLWLGAYKEPEVFSGISLDELRARLGYADERASSCADDKMPSYWARSIRPSEAQISYAGKIARIKEHITAGDTYQVNYTFKLKYDFFGDPLSLFLDLNKRQGVSYAAFIKHSSYAVLSLSPEMFFRRDKGCVTARPMKGTCGRGGAAGTQDEAMSDDETKARGLYLSQKNRAENIMIVDLFRNDIGRISEKGSVAVPSLFDIERYETLHQMTSTVEGRLTGEPGWFDIFRAMFPSGSVTGAPKIRTMRIIRELENEPRGIYTGAIGFIAPDNGAVFNIPIRTLVIDKNRHSGEMGVGSGIVIDSDTEAEYEECLLKARFFTGLERSYKLIETMLWMGDKGFYLLEYHLERLAESARYFAFTYDEKAVRRRLSNVEKGLKRRTHYRVRLLLDSSGESDIGCVPLLTGPAGKPRRVRFAAMRTDPANIFLYHKTTNRALYDDEYALARKEGFLDAIFMNRAGQVTEGAVSNVVIQRNGILYTPPVSCGLLNGIYRRHLLASEKGKIEERILTPDDIQSADSLFLINSVRGMAGVVLTP